MRSARGPQNDPMNGRGKEGEVQTGSVLGTAQRFHCERGCLLRPRSPVRLLILCSQSLNTGVPGVCLALLLFSVHTPFRGGFTILRALKKVGADNSKFISQAEIPH